MKNAVCYMWDVTVFQDACQDWYSKPTATRTIFHLRLQCNFQKLLRFHRAEKTATQLYGALAKFTDRKLPEYSEFSLFLQIFQKMLYCQRKICCTQKFVLATHGNAIIS